MLEEAAGIHCGGVADVAAFCVGDDELVGIILFQILYCLFQSGPAFDAEAFIECEVWLVCHAVRSSGVDYCFVELENRIGVVFQMLRDFLDVSVKAYAKK